MIILRDENNLDDCDKIFNIGEENELDSLLEKINPNYVYIRLSPNTDVLKLAAQIVDKNRYKIISHYMDIPSNIGLQSDEILIIDELYKKIIHNSSLACVIHEASIPDFEARYSVTPLVVGNFPVSNPLPRKILSLSESEAIKVRYFGGIDYKMNATALLDFCLVVSKTPWVLFEIYSNSGINKELRKVLERSKNIKIIESNLDEATYNLKLKEADVLLLPYNWDDESLIYLKHSFSNKVLDYLEIGVPVIAVGPKGIPTMDVFLQLKPGLAAHSNLDILEIFQSKKKFIDTMNLVNKQNYNAILDFLCSRKKNLDLFFSKITEGAENIACLHTSEPLGEEFKNSLYEKCTEYFQSRRKIFIEITGISKA